MNELENMMRKRRKVVANVLTWLAKGDAEALVVVEGDLHIACDWMLDAGHAEEVIGLVRKLLGVPHIAELPGGTVGPTGGTRRIAPGLAGGCRVSLNDAVG